MISGSKRLFLRGLGTLLPTLLTLIILIKLIGFVYENFGKYIGMGLVQTAGWVHRDLGKPSQEQLSAYMESRGIDKTKISPKQRAQIVHKVRQKVLRDIGQTWQVAILGFFLALVLVWVLGVFLASIFGRKLWQMLENTIVKIPVFKQIYPYVKQVTDYVFGERKLEFARVVSVPYPRKGIWSLGFVTGPAIEPLNELSEDGKGCLTVFIPTSPTPLTGFVITVPKAEVIDLPLTIDQAFRYILSGGVITPDTEIPSQKDLT